MSFTNLTALNQIPIKNYISTIVTSNGTNALSGNFESGSTSSFSLAHSALSSFIPTSVASPGSAFSASSGGTAASGNLSFLPTSSGQLSGSYSGNLASSAASTAGDMLISNAFFIDTEDKAKMMSVIFQYSAISGTFNFSGTSSNTHAIYIYDVTNGVWIQPAGVYNLVQSSGTGVCTATFQTASNSTQYQLALININATAGAYSLYLDDFSVGPQTVQKGPAIGDWNNNLTFTFSGVGTPTNVSTYTKREGDSLRIRGSITFGTPTATTFSINLPGGYSIDTSKFPATATQQVGIMLNERGGNSFAATNSGPYPLFFDGSTASAIFVCGTAGTASFAKANGSAVFNAADAGGFEFLIPIAGWSSNSVMSSDTDTRVVDFVGTKSATQAVTANVTDITVTTVKDSHAGWSGSAYTIPVSGDYVIGNMFYDNASTTESYTVYKNGSTTNRTVSQSVNGSIAPGSTLLSGLNAGDTISIRSSQTTTIGGSAGTPGYIYINRLSGPAVITATETVAASYYATGSTTSSTSTPVNFDTKDYDTHNAVTTGASWKFTAPVSGKYALKGYGDSGANAIIAVYKNGTKYAPCGCSNSASGSSWAYTIKLLAGDFIDIRSTSSVTFTGNATQSSDGASNVQIERIGN